MLYFTIDRYVFDCRCTCESDRIALVASSHHESVIFFLFLHVRLSFQCCLCLVLQHLQTHLEIFVHILFPTSTDFCECTLLWLSSPHRSRNRVNMKRIEHPRLIIQCYSNFVLCCTANTLPCVHSRCSMYTLPCAQGFIARRTLHHAIVLIYLHVFVRSQ